MTFLNGDIEEKVYMKQPEGFSSREGEHFVCKLKQSEASLPSMVLKIPWIISSYGFVENPMNQCIYQKVSESKLVLYMDDFLLATNNKGMM